MIYLDNSATTMPDERILQTFLEANRRFFANPASIHAAGIEADQLLQRSRGQALHILRAPDGQAVFTSGGTEANNLAIIGTAHAYAHRGRHLITTSIEHPSVLQSFAHLETQGFIVDYLSVNDEGIIDVNEMRQALRSDTILVSIMHVNNEIGAIQPIEQCAKIIKEHSRALFHTDAVQSFGKLPIYLDEKGPDLLTISAHKCNGIKGSGLLAAKKNIHLSAINFGGGQEFGIRSGTVSVPHAAALAKTMRISDSERGRQPYEKWKQRIVEHCLTLANIKIVSGKQSAPHILSIAFAHITGEVAVNFLQENKIYVSTSSACSSKKTNTSHVIEAVGLAERFKKGVIRISFGKDNTEEEISKLENALTHFSVMLQRSHL